MLKQDKCIPTFHSVTCHISDIPEVLFIFRVYVKLDQSLWLLFLLKFVGKKTPCVSQRNWRQCGNVNVVKCGKGQILRTLLIFSRVILETISPSFPPSLNQGSNSLLSQKFFTVICLCVERTAQSWTTVNQNEKLVSYLLNQNETVVNRFVVYSLLTLHSHKWYRHEKELNSCISVSNCE